MPRSVQQLSLKDLRKTWQVKLHLSTGVLGSQCNYLLRASSDWFPRCLLGVFNSVCGFVRNFWVLAFGKNVSVVTQGSLSEVPQNNWAVCSPFRSCMHGRPVAHLPQGRGCCSLCGSERGVAVLSPSLCVTPGSLCAAFLLFLLSPLERPWFLA